MRGLVVTRTDIKALHTHAKREKAARLKREAAAAVGGGVHRGTSNRNARGSAEDRRRRREYLVETYRSDTNPNMCRCYRCGVLLNVEAVTVDRIKPGALGGTYTRTNIRPACARRNSETGGAVRSPSIPNRKATQ